MYQVVIETMINGKREIDRVRPYVYSKKGFAERAARKDTYSFSTTDGRIVEFRAYVRGLLRPVSKANARAAYNSLLLKRIWVDGKYGQVCIARASECGLFDRSIEQSVGCNYEGNFYIEDK